MRRLRRIRRARRAGLMRRLLRVLRVFGMVWVFWLLGVLVACFHRFSLLCCLQEASEAPSTLNSVSHAVFRTAEKFVKWMSEFGSNQRSQRWWQRSVKSKGQSSTP
jgi:hypothetical protein